MFRPNWDCCDRALAHRDPGPQELKGACPIFIGIYPYLSIFTDEIIGNNEYPRVETIKNNEN